MPNRQLTTSQLPIFPADPGSPIPLYHQVETSLRGMVQSGLIAPGDTLPPELELSRAYGVSRHTMRMALSRLVDENLIARKAGRGTIVSQPADRMKFYLDRSFTHQMADMGRTSRSRVLEASTGVITAESPAALRTRLGAPYFHLVRLRLGGEEPIGLQSALVVTELCPGLETYDFNRESLYDVLAREYKLVIAEIGHTASAVAADAEQARLLGVTPGAPLLVVTTTTYLNDGQIIEYTTSYYRADRYEYSTTTLFTPC